MHLHKTRPDSLSQPLTTIPGVGDVMKKALQRLGCVYIKDLLYHLPSHVIERKTITGPAWKYVGESVRARFMVESWDDPPRNRHINPKKPFRIYGHIRGTAVDIVYFNQYPHYHLQWLQPGMHVFVSGKLDQFGKSLTIAHPDYLVQEARAHQIPDIDIVYPLTKGLSNKQLLKFLDFVLQRIPDLPEWLTETSYPRWKQSILSAHHPSTLHDIATSHARQRLAYDELLAHQLALGWVRQQGRTQKGTSYQFDGQLQQKALQRVGFSLTQGQQDVLTTIASDQRSSQQMMRLLQGDVGCGKTVIALCTLLNAIEAGYQGAFMAPTDLLAQQHATWIKSILLPMGIHVALLTGRTKAKERTEILASLYAGSTSLLIGTHALFQSDVQFKQLGCIIIDEQHRFGVKQRMALIQKGLSPDVLVMTATPIPRTLALTQFGDMEVSQLKEKPLGRVPITTRIISISRLDDVMHATQRAIEKGDQIYWVCPLIEQNIDETQAANDMAAVTERYRYLYHMLPNQVGFIHGQMKGQEKDDIMMRFSQGELKILVATTVIEVGIHVPNATIMIIEQAERFGLAQLHQLRGRIGRGSKASFCLLLHGHALNETSRSRLEVMRETEDGFRIAEEDLVLRGSGDVVGIKQSGMPHFKVAILPDHMPLLEKAHQEATTILQHDPNLTSEKGRYQRILMDLFDYDLEKQCVYSG